MKNTVLLDALTRTHTAWNSFAEMIEKPAADYFPTLTAKGTEKLADAYDAEMKRRGDSRRAWKGSRKATLPGTVAAVVPVKLTYEQEQAIRERERTVGSLTAEQITRAYAICDEFGAMYSGIRDRVDSIVWDMRHNGSVPMAERVYELLSGVNPAVATRIMGW
jgi:hypothetical protein